MDAVLSVSHSDDKRALHAQPFRPSILTTSNASKLLTSSLSWPWRRNKNPQDPHRVFTISRWNYRVYADLVPDTKRLRPVLAILDTGVGSNFIRRSELPEVGEYPLRYGPLSQVCDANGKRVCHIWYGKSAGSAWEFSCTLRVCGMLAPLCSVHTWYGLL